VETRVSALGDRLAAVVLLALTAAYAIAVVVEAPRSLDTYAGTYAGASTLAEAVDLVAGLALLAAGLAAWSEQRMRPIGVLSVLAGLVWFAPDWEGWEHGPALVVSLGAVVTPLLVPLVLHITLAYPSGRVGSRPRRWIVLAAYLLAVAATVTTAVVREPLLDPDCWRNCVANVFLLSSDPGLAQEVGRDWLDVVVVLSALIAVFALWRLVQTTRPSRRSQWPVLIPCLLFGLAEAAYAGELLRMPQEDPRTGVYASLFVLRAASLTALALGILYAVARARRRRGAVARLVTDLGESPAVGKLRDTLAAALGDPSLEIVYRLFGGHGFVGSEGRPVPRPSEHDGRGISEIDRDGRLLAVVSYDAAVIDDARLQRGLGTAARLALENEQLRAGVLAQLADLRASQTRIVERADAERRRLERDLHDGAQQRLLALSYDLRLASAGARADGDTALTATLEAAVDEAAEALDELRELAHGIYPAILTEAGLGPALETLVDTARVPVELSVDSGLVRASAAVETAAYVAVAEGIMDAASREATLVTAAVSYEADVLVVEIHDDGQPRGAPLVHVRDRVGAVGGSLELGPMQLRLEIPCA
jgi:signal transduction histidine kinase